MRQKREAMPKKYAVVIFTSLPDPMHDIRRNKEMRTSTPTHKKRFIPVQAPSFSW